MARTSDAALVTIWEQGVDRHPVDRALLLLALSQPDVDTASLARVCLGEREDRLLRLRAELFGDRLEAFASCPSCGARVEVALSVRALRERPCSPEAGEVMLETGALRARARLPDSLDLAAAVGCQDATRGRDMLLSRVISELSRAGERAQLEGLDESERAALSDALGDVDPRAETLLSLRCAECEANWVSSLDAAGYLWRELEREVKRILDEVDLIARTYGWSEAAILGLGRRRRRAYLERVRA